MSQHEHTETQTVKVFYCYRESSFKHMLTLTIPVNVESSKILIPVSLQKCLSSICRMSPEFICKIHDLSVYTVNFEESENSSHDGSLIWEGHGLMTWIMAKDQDAVTVLGKKSSTNVIEIHIQLQPTVAWSRDELDGALDKQDFSSLRSCPRPLPEQSSSCSCILSLYQRASPPPVLPKTGSPSLSDVGPSGMSRRDSSLTSHTTVSSPPRSPPMRLPHISSALQLPSIRSGNNNTGSLYSKKIESLHPIESSSLNRSSNSDECGRTSLSTCFYFSETKSRHHRQHSNHSTVGDLQQGESCQSRSLFPSIQPYNRLDCGKGTPYDHDIGSHRKRTKSAQILQARSSMSTLPSSKSKIGSIVRTYYEVERDTDGKYVLPVEIDSWTVIDLGTVVNDRPAYHNQRYIYPINYTVRKWYRSMVDPKRDTQYTCRILDNGPEPKFEVTADDCAQTFSGATPTTVWTIIVRRAFAIRNQEYSHNPVGPDFFGLRKSTIAKMIQDLPGASCCSQYIWQTFQPARHHKQIRSRRRADANVPRSLLSSQPSSELSDTKL